MINTIKLERKKLQISCKQLAKKVGVSKTTIKAVEKGLFTPSALLAIKIAKALNKKVSEIFYLDEDESIY